MADSEKFALRHFTFTKIHISICFVNQGIWRWFLLLQKSAKILKRGFCCFVDFVFLQQTLEKAAGTCIEWRHQASSEELHPASSSHSFELCEHLCFISVCSVHPLSRWISRYLLLHFYAILASERLSRNGLLLGDRKTVFTHRVLNQFRLIGIDCLMKDFIKNRDYCWPCPTRRDETTLDLEKYPEFG